MKLTRDEWLDSQQGEAKFWARQTADGNQEQRRRDGWYRDVCFPDFFAHYDFRGAYLVDLGSGPQGILATIPEASKRIQVDPLFNEFGRQGFAPLPGIDNRAEACEATTLPSAYFDVAFCLNMLDHSQEPEAVLGEAARLLVPNGWLILCVDMRPANLIDKLHKLRLDSDTICRWLANAGFRGEWRAVPHQAGNAAVQFCGEYVKAKGGK
jgi:SAM-dependent methyltransferase